MIRIGTAQPRSRLLDYRLSPAEALVRLEENLDALEAIVRQAGAAGCDVLALPEDTLGLGLWEEGNRDRLDTLLPTAVARMLERLSRATAEQNMYLVCCSDTVEPDGTARNTAFFLGRDGREIGRYWKVNMPIHERFKEPGDHYPVFSTPDLGGVGMLICYEMVFPEAARCLALGGADIIFHPTLGGAAIGDEEISRAAYRTRAVENFVYLVVSQRGHGAMVVSPQGRVLAEGEKPDDLVIADIDPFGGREGGDSMNYQKDMRARLFRERIPTAFGRLTEPNPPVLQKVPETLTIAESLRISAQARTVGEEQFQEAETLRREGKTAEARAAFARLRNEYPGTWIDRVGQERLATLEKERVA
jgi:predicted amidohydrolase